MNFMWWIKYVNLRQLQFFSTDRQTNPTNLVIEAPFRSLKTRVQFLIYWPIKVTNKRGLSCAKLSQQSTSFLGSMELFFFGLDCWWLYCWIVELLDCWIVDLLNCWMVKLLKCWIVELLNCWIVELLNYWKMELLNCWTVELLNG